MRILTAASLFIFLMVNSIHAVSQDSAIAVSKNYIAAVNSRASDLQSKLDKHSEKAIRQMIKLEARMKKKLMKTDSLAAHKMFDDAEAKFANLANKISSSKVGNYLPKLDSLSTSIKFLEQHPGILNNLKDHKQKLEKATANLNGLKSEFAKAEQIKSFLKERKEYLKEQLGKLGFAKELKKMNKRVYYYSAQVNEYKQVLKDSKKAERKALELLSKTKIFKDFMRKNSQLASLFRLPGDANDPSSQVSLAGLQTRAQVNGLIQQQIAAGGPGAAQQVQQNMQAAQAQLAQLKDKILKAGGSGSGDEMPEGFKPNNQRTKGFWKRVELGTNFQTTKGNGWWPTTTDFGLSLGYKLNDRSVIGIGSSYKLGWGNNIRHMRISHQGVGVRSFIDWKIKGSFWITGGFEANYRSVFHSINDLKGLNAWQQSGLLGLSKSVSIRSKFFKKTKLQLLWDFLSYRQIPKPAPILFRIGYHFN